MQNIIAAHRRELADALSTLTAAQWRAPSLCAGWTAAHVLAHQTMPFRISEQDFVAGLQRCGGDFTTFSDEIADRDSHLPPAELVAALRDNADTPWSPPGGGLAGALCHDVIHGLDIGWPLALAYEIPAAAMTAVLNTLTSPLALDQDDVVAAEVQAAAADADTRRATVFGFPLDGIRVLATDLPWSAGSGADLAGASRDLLPLLAGRQIPHDRFRGAGAARAWSLASQ
ncbi:MAG: maleylpyruvate isomerase family mycothiol-dependent enzyme [Streptosporangiaceae bacterium]